MRHPDFGKLQRFWEAQLVVDETEAFIRRFLATLFDWHANLPTFGPCGKTDESSHMIYLGHLPDYDCRLIRVRFANRNGGVMVGKDDFNPRAGEKEIKRIFEESRRQRQEFLTLVAEGPLIRVEAGEQQFPAFAWRTITPMYLTRDLLDFLYKHLNAIWELLSREHPELVGKMDGIVERAKVFGLLR